MFPDSFLLMVRDNLYLDDIFERTSDARKNVLADYILRSSCMLIDHLFDDLDVLEHPGTSASPATFGVLGALPRRYSSRYDAAFTRRMIVTASAINDRWLAGWEGPGCVAEALITTMIMSAVSGLARSEGVSLPRDWRDRVEAEVFGNLDHLWLYEDAMDGIDEMSQTAMFNIQSLRFDDWFKPWPTQPHIAPYGVYGTVR